jgi:outer membrane protein assembly factor BamC
MPHVTRSSFSRLPVAVAVATLLALSACSSLEGVADNRIDYRGTKTRQTSLDVPPDLTQLDAESGRFQPQGGTVSATSYQAAASAPATVAPATLGTRVPTATNVATTTAAAQATGPFRIERSGDVRWLATTLTPEQLWPQLQGFFQERSMTLVVDQPAIGAMETEWAENRAKLPNDLVRRTLGKVLNPLFSTGERDKFRLRVERVPGGSELYITHKGMEEVYSGQMRESTVWQIRPRDPLLEAEMLSRIMVKLGAPADQAKAVEVEAAKPTAAAAPVAPTRARILQGRPAATLQVDDGFDRAWRRVGLALDRSGFTVEDRDRAQGVYFVRYVDPAQAGKDEPGFFSRLFSRKDANAFGPVRYRVTVKAEGESSIVSVLDAQGGPENGEAGKRIVGLLTDDLK